MKQKTAADEGGASDSSGINAAIEYYQAVDDNASTPTADQMKNLFSSNYLNSGDISVSHSISVYIDSRRVIKLGLQESFNTSALEHELGFNNPDPQASTMPGSQAHDNVE